MKLHWPALGLMALAVSIAAATLWSAEPEQQRPGGVVNGDFEQQNSQGLPDGWVFPPALAKSGYRLQLDRSNPQSGKQSALIDATGATLGDNMFGNLMQSIDAKPFRGKRVRFKAAVRTGELANDGRAQLWFRVDRAGPGGEHRMGAFDNMQDRPIRDASWKHYEIVGKVDADATRIYVGMLVLGKGKAWIDDATLEVVSDETPSTGAAVASLVAAADDPPQPFFVPWLALPAIAIGLMVLSQTKSSMVQRIALRFSFGYWLLYYLPAPLDTLLLGWGYRITQPYRWGVDQAVRWTAKQVLGIERTLVAPNGSGDTTFDYVRILLCFCLALAIAAIWTAIDRRKTDYRWLSDLLRSYLRYVLAFIMLGYGLAKVSSTYNQFPAPEIDQLMKPYGDSSPMNLVWTFMGSSLAYTVFCGLGEVSGALLLVWRRTATLGALVTVGVMANVVMLNFCYDVPVKQFSTHLLVMAIFIALPDVPRLAGILIQNRAVEAVEMRPPYVGPRTIWIQRGAKLAILVIGLGFPLSGWAMREIAGRQAIAPPPAFGAYEVESLTRGGEEVEPLLTDATRWRTVTLRRFPSYGSGRGPRDMLLIRMMDNSLVAAPVVVSPDGKSLAQSSSASLPGVLTIRHVDDRHIELTGAAQGKPVVARLRRLSREDYLLVRRGFRWINEYPYNR